MYINLGNNTLVKTQDIIGIFDLDNTTVSARTRQFLRKAEQDKKIVLTGYELPKSFVVTSEKGEIKIYLSMLAPSTLNKRFENIESNYFKEL